MVWGYPGLQRYRVTYGFVFGEQGSSLTWGSHTGSGGEKGGSGSHSDPGQLAWSAMVQRLLSVKVGTAERTLPSIQLLIPGAYK